jgi:hypothetical protein
MRRTVRLREARTALSTDTLVAIALAGTAAALAVVSAWGYLLRAGGVQLHLGVIPFFGELRWRPTGGLLVTVLAGAAIVTAAPRLAATLDFRRLLLAAWASAAAWAVALATASGWAGLTAPLESRFDYWSVLPVVRTEGLGPFVRGYVDHLATYPVHVEGHPPGMVALYWLLDRVGLPGPGWAAAAVIAIGASAVPAVLVAARELTGEQAARRAAPFLVVAPMALFVATTADAVFAGLAAWAVALLAVAARRQRAGTAVAAGALGTLTLYFTYGLVPLLLALGGLVLWRLGRVTVALWAAAGALAVAAAWSLAGFSWLAGLRAAHHFYGLRAGDDRPYSYFLIADVVVFAVMLGPAVIAGLVRLSDRAVFRVVAAALVAVAIADLSGLSKAEVERIWLPFLPWVTLATAALPRRQVGRWLAAQAALAIALQITIGWPW